MALGGQKVKRGAAEICTSEKQHSRRTSRGPRGAVIDAVASHFFVYRDKYFWVRLKYPVI